MAGGKTSLHETAVLNVMRATTLTSFAAFVALYTVAPTDTTAGTEVTGGSYAAASCAFSAPTGSGPTSMVNSAEILISMPTCSVVAVGLKDAVGGALRYFVGITTVAFTSGDQARFAAGSITVTEE
jgi:hypothetical protein